MLSPRLAPDPTCVRTTRIPTEELKRVSHKAPRLYPRSPNDQNSDRGIETLGVLWSCLLAVWVRTTRIPTEELKLGLALGWGIFSLRPNDQNSDRGIETNFSTVSASDKPDWSERPEFRPRN